MIKYVRVASDLHLEWCKITNFPNLETDKETLLVLAGDILELYAIRKFEFLVEGGHDIHFTLERLYSAFDEFLNQIKGRYAAVVAVAGNHEFYGSELTAESYQLLREFYSRYGVTFLEKECITLTAADGKDINIFGGTFWTDFKEANPTVMWDARSCMSDYSQTLDSDGNRLHPSATYDDNVIFREQLSYIMKAKFHKDSYNIVVSHHAPDLKSIHEKFKGGRNDAYNYFYANTKMDEFFDGTIKYWFHGHTHENVDYTINGTRVIANPRGYYKDIRGIPCAYERRVDDFEPDLLLKIME